MLTVVAVTAGTRHAGHPLWHLLIVAGTAIGAFLVIKLKEHWNQHNHHHRGHDGQSPPAPRSRLPTGPVLTLALLSATAATIHGAVFPAHFHEAFLYGAFFVTASALQAACAVALIYRPSRTMLLAAIISNSAVIALWTATRTIGLPVGPHPWTAEPVGVLDAASTCLELLIVIGATKLFTQTNLATGDTLTQRLDLLRTQHPTLLRQHTGPAR